VRLWHDSSAWHPFANQVWILLEEMQIPHVRATVPLEQYLKPGERMPEEFTRLGVSVPAIQVLDKVATSRTSTRNGTSQIWSAPLKEKSAVDIFRKLHKLFPTYALFPKMPRRKAFAEALLDQYPRLQSAAYAVMMPARARAHEMYVSAMNHFDGAWSGDPRANASLARFGDDGDGIADNFGGSLEGPFLFGERPCAVDVLVLPLLERCEANIPDPRLGNAPQLSLKGWPALARLQAHARIPGVCAYSELGTDAHTTVGIRLAVTNAITYLPSVQSFNLHQLLTVAGHVSADARRDAASRLISNHIAVTGFACAGRGTGRSRQEIRPSPTDAVRACTSDALQAVAHLLLSASEGVRKLETMGDMVAARIFALYDRASAEAAIGNLIFLAENTSVPRDMSTASAVAFRVYLQLMAKLLDNCRQPKVPHARA
jgi:glutathione S-transferase